VLAASTSGKRFNLIALACLLTAAAPINGPLLQRSSTVAFQAVDSNATVAIPALQVLDRPTAYMSGRGYDVSLFTQNFSAIVQDFYNGTDISVASNGCDGVCIGRLRAAGLALNCSSTTMPFDLDFPEQGPTFDSDVARVQAGYDVFQSHFTFDTFTQSFMDLAIQYKDNVDCAGTIAVQNCTFQMATVQYPVIIDANRSTITLDPGTTMFDDIIEDKVDLGSNRNEGISIFGGLSFALNNRFGSNANLRFTGAVPYTLLMNGPSAPRYAVYNGDVTESCAIYFDSPQSDMVQQARELMFRTAIAWGNDTTIQQMPSAQALNQLVYQSRYLYLGLAVLASTLAVLAISFIFHGYWHLGRRVTMSPIEIAKAFNAPLLHHEDSNAEANELVKNAGQRIVRYGGVSVTDTPDANDEVSKQPYVFTSRDMREMSYSHLEIADAAIVYTPELDSVFVSHRVHSDEQQSLIEPVSLHDEEPGQRSVPDTADS